MEKIDFKSSYFTFQKIIPESPNDLTSLWARKIVHNLANAYGLIGTIRLSGADWHWVNLGLTSRFQFPPTLHCLYMYDNDGNLQQDDNDWYRGKDIAIAIQGDNVGFKGNSLKPNVQWGYDFVDVYFRFYGC